MPDSTAQRLLAEILATGKRQGLTQALIAERAGLAAETLSRLKRADDVRLSSLQRLAAVVGLRLTLVADDDLAEQIGRRELF
jgi:transcriptional regulator with XRE-family HTH domain